MRASKIARKTKETDVKVELNLDGTGKAKIKTPVKFLNHMLDNFAKHSRFNLNVTAKGDVEIEDHHLVEDIGICIGEAIDKALGNKKGIARTSYAIVPMDDSISTVTVDLSGRPYAIVDLPFSEFYEKKVGDLTKENVVHFFESMALNGKFNLRIETKGKNDHHKVESCFKAFAKALHDSTRIIGKEIPSTKGRL